MSDGDPNGFVRKGLIGAWFPFDFSLREQVCLDSPPHVPPLLVEPRASALVLDVARPRLLANGEVCRLDLVKCALVDLLGLHELLVVRSHVVVDAPIHRLGPLRWCMQGKVVGISAYERVSVSVRFVAVPKSNLCKGYMCVSATSRQSPYFLCLAVSGRGDCVILMTSS